MGCADCSNLLPIFDSRSASSLPSTLQWEGIHWRATDVLFLSRDSSCLMLLKIWSPPGDWRLCRMDRQSVKNTVGRKSLFLVQSLGCYKQGVGFSSVVCWLLPCSYRLPDGSAIGEINENSTSAIFCCLFCWPICGSSCPGGWRVGNTKGFQGQ